MKTVYKPGQILLSKNGSNKPTMEVREVFKKEMTCFVEIQGQRELTRLLKTYVDKFYVIEGGGEDAASVTD